MKFKLIGTTLLSVQIIAASCAFAQSPTDSNNKDATAQAIQSVRTTAQHYQDRGNLELVGSAGFAIWERLIEAARVSAWSNSPERVYGRMSYLKYKAMRSEENPNFGKFQKGLVILSAVLLGKSLIDQGVGDYYQNKAANLSLEKTLPAPITGGNAGNAPQLKAGGVPQ